MVPLLLSAVDPGLHRRHRVTGGRPLRIRMVFNTTYWLILTNTNNKYSLHVTLFVDICNNTLF